MARKRSLLSWLVLVSLLHPGCAWETTTNNEVTTGGLLRRHVPRNGLLARGGSEELWGRVEDEVIQIVEEQIKVITAQQPREQRREHSAAPAAVAPRTPQITPPPSLALYKRQNDAQIQQLSGQIQSISGSFRSVSQASQQVSQSSQQLSNSLQQAQQQLSRSAQSLASASASASAASQSAQSASQAAQQASQDADQARQSASSAVSSAQSSASSAADAAASSAAQSVASAMASMSASAAQVMSSAASLVQAARADATAAANEADTRVMQAQGAAVSVTQAALAIVGAIVGSSLLTIAAFVVVLRYKRRRRDRRSLAAAPARSSISYYPGRQRRPSGGGGAGGGGYGGDDGGVNVDVKEPEPAVQPQRAGFAAVIGANRASFRLRTPPKGKYSVFPRARDVGKRGEGAASPTSEYSEANEKDKARGEARQSKMASPANLEKWLRVGTDVSPFGTLNAVSNGGQAKKQIMGKNWPLGRKGLS